ncbi:unnamed protein product [Schistosoma margrebowiei]|uniref:Uncharacterized protein n=1 Tax=Schistosoma margrebowiei TaxID=48269 RepID=A0A183MCX9_9TREM|nr:unnamed protein product [Schistosoma margrebowiei]
MNQLNASTYEKKHGGQRTDRMQMDYLDFVDDLALLSQSQQQMQEKTTSVAAASAAVACTNPITLHGEHLDDVKTSTYLGSIIDEHGGSDTDVKVWIGKARAAYLQLKDIWNSKQLSINQHQGLNFQYKCQDGSTEWGRNLENYESHHPEDTSVY